MKGQKGRNGYWTDYAINKELLKPLICKKKDAVVFKLHLPWSGNSLKREKWFVKKEFPNNIP